MTRIPLKLRADGFACVVACVVALGAILMMVGPAFGQGRPNVLWMSGGHAAGVPSVALSPDNQSLATASFDTSVKLFDLSTGLLQHTLEAHTIAALAVAYSPDGTRVVSSGYDGSVMVWNAQTGAPIGALMGHAGAVFAVAYSPDGTKIATGSADQTVKVWDAATGALIGTLSGHSDWVYAVTFSPDGATLASGSGDGTIRLWRVSDGAHIGTLAGHTGYVLSVAFSPSGDLLASGSNDDTTRLWQMSDGAEIGTFTGQTLVVYDAIFSPDGTRLASGAGDGTIVIRTVSDGAVERTIPLPAGVLSLAYTSDGKVFAGCDDGSVSLWNTTDGSFVKKVTGHTSMVRGVAVSPDGLLAASGADDGSVRVYGMADGQTTLVIEGVGDGVSSVAFSPDGALICSGGYDGTASIWQVSDGSLVHQLTGHTDSVMSVAFSPDGSTVATGSADTTIKLWNVAGGAGIGTLSGHFGTVLGLAFSPDGEKLASVGADGKLILWRLSDGAQLWTQTAASGWCHAVAFSPDGSAVATGAAAATGGTLKLWNAADGTPIAGSASGDPVRSLAFSPDGLVIATGGNRGDVGRLQFWQANNLGLLQTYDQETGSGTATYGVTAVAYNPDRTALVYGRNDATVVKCANPFWPVPTMVTPLPVTGQIGEIVVLKADLTVLLSGAPILGKPIAFDVAGTPVGSGTTDGAGRAVCDFRIPEALGVGDQTIGASFAGDSAYGASSGTATLTITRANTNVTADRVAGILGDTVTLRATLIRTTDDSPLPGRTVSFKVEATSVGTALTDASGVATIDFVIPLSLGAGDRTITVSFAGDANNKECTGYGVLVAAKRPTALAVQDASGQIGVAVALSAVLTFRGQPVSGGTLAFTVDGTEVGLAQTDDSGQASIGYQIPEGPGAGSRTIGAEYAGDSVYDRSSGSATLTVGVTNTLCYVPDLDRTGAAGLDVVLRAYLYRTTDRGPVVGRSVSFTVDGVYAYTAVTEATGRATGYYTLPREAQSGVNIVQATFAGDATYNGSTGQGRLTLTVQKAATYMWVMPRLAVRGAATYLRAYLRRAADMVWLPDKNVAFKVDGTDVGSAVTDPNGRASLLYFVAADMSAGDHTITASFAGDSLYLGSTADGWMFVY
jgi:WD40 repeat protein